MNVAIDNITVTTENCSIEPYYAEPGTGSLLLSAIFAYLPNCCEQLNTERLTNEVQQP